MQGIDISTHNGTVNFEKVKKAGIDFVMIRAGYGKNNIDKQFKRNISECNRLGIPCGVYWFSYALSVEMAKSEAKYCLDAVKPYKLEFPIAYDLEYDSVNYANKHNLTITKAIASSFVKAFCGEIEKAGYYALNYGNQDYLKRYFDDEINKKYGRWLAAWNKKDNPPYECQIWQFSNAGNVDGISGRVDLDKSFIDFPKIIKERGLNGFKKDVGKDVGKETWYTDALKWGIENGITNGKNPESNATRAQVITMLKRYHDKFYKS